MLISLRARLAGAHCLPLLLLHLTFAVASSATAQTQNLQLPLAQPVGVSMKSSQPALREHALRMAAYSGKTDEVFKTMATEHNPEVLRATLDALASVGALRDIHVPYVLGLTRSPDDTTTVLGYSLLPACAASDNPSQVAPEAQEPSIYRHGLAHRSSRVRATAARAAVRTKAGLSLLPEFEKLAASANPDDRRTGIEALIARSMQLNSPGRPGSVQKTAMTLFEQDETRGKDIVGGLLQIGLPVSESLYTALFSLPEKALRETIVRYGNFPDFYDSDFLRIAAMQKYDSVAQPAIRLLASRPSPKNVSTLDTLCRVLVQGSPPRLEALLSSFSAPPDFAALYRADLASKSPVTVTANNDRFGISGGNVPNALLGEALTPDDFLMQTRFLVPDGQRPTLESIKAFIKSLESLSSNTMLAPGSLANAHRLILQELGSGSLPNIVSHLLASGQPDNIQQAVNLALAFVGDEHLLEIVLQNYAADNSPVRNVQLARMDAFLPRTTSARSRSLSRMGRLLVGSHNSEKRITGLVLLAAHGNPADAVYISPLISATDVITRRAAFHALARVAPETFLLKMAGAITDPDPLVRATVPLLFSRTGFRWEHHLSPALRIAQWVPPNSDFKVTEEHFRVLKLLGTDPDPVVRLRALLALLQHGRLDDAERLLELHFFEGNSSLHTARLRQSTAAAYAFRHSVPQLFSSLARKSLGPQPRAPTLALFVSPESAINASFDTTLDSLAATFPGIRILTWYNGTTATDTARAAIFRHYPVPFLQKGKPVLVFSSGAWEASDSLPDFARLHELVAHANDTEPRRLERILGLDVMPSMHEHPVRSNPLFDFPNILILVVAGAALLLALSLGLAKGLQIVRSRYQKTRRAKRFPPSTRPARQHNRKKHNQRDRKNKHFRISETPKR